MKELGRAAMYAVVSQKFLLIRRGEVVVSLRNPDN